MTGHRSERLSQCTCSLGARPRGAHDRTISTHMVDEKPPPQGDGITWITYSPVGLGRRRRRELISAQVGVMTAVDEVVGDGLGEILLIRQRVLDYVKPVLQHQDVDEVVVSISRIPQSDILLALRLEQKLLKLLPLDM